MCTLIIIRYNMTFTRHVYYCTLEMIVVLKTDLIFGFGIDLMAADILDVSLYPYRFQNNNLR